MTKSLDDTVSLGDPDHLAQADKKPFFEEGRPRLGGLQRPVGFTDDEASVINAIADTMIPPGGGFPAPSEIDIVDFFGRYTTPRGYATKHYPFVEEDELKAALAQLGNAFSGADIAGRTTQLGRVENEQEELFAKLRSLVYYGYYASRAVTLAIQAQIPYGRDYHGAPLPYGYIDCIEDWDDEALASAGQGSFIPTDEVTRVDLGKVTWLRNRSTTSDN